MSNKVYETKQKQFDCKVCQDNMTLSTVFRVEEYQCGDVHYFCEDCSTMTDEPETHLDDCKECTALSYGGTQQYKIYERDDSNQLILIDEQNSQEDDYYD